MPLCMKSDSKYYMQQYKIPMALSMKPTFKNNKFKECDKILRFKG